MALCIDSTVSPGRIGSEPIAIFSSDYLANPEDVELYDMIIQQLGWIVNEDSIVQEGLPISIEYILNG